MTQRTFIKTSFVACLACVLLVSIGRTQEFPATKEPSALEAELGVELRYDDNIFQSSTGVKPSWITIVSPGFAINARPSRHLFSLKYNGVFSRYADSEPDNSDDHQVEAGAYLDFSRRAKLDLEGSYIDSHENRGTGLTEGFIPAINIPQNPDEFRAAEIMGRFSYGSTESNGQLVFESGYRDLEYTSNRDRTRFFDRTEIYGDATLYYRVMPHTSLLFDARVMDFSYQNVRVLEPSPDSKQYSYLVGITSNSTAKVTGTIKVGYVEKTYNEGLRDDFTGLSWVLDVRYSPRTYSHIDFQTSRVPTESNGRGDFIVATSYSVTWQHDWSQRIKSEIAALRLDEDFRGSVADQLQDLSQINLSLAYRMRNWLTWRIGVEVNSRDSDVDRFVFDGNVYYVRLSLTR